MGTIQTLRMLIIVASALLSFGCGETELTGKVNGKVLLENQPLPFGGVMLQPSDGGPSATGQIQSDGSFSLKTDGQEEVAVGMHRIRVTCFPAQKPGSSQAEKGELALGKSLIPIRYNNFGSSGLSVVVKEGENEPLIIKLTKAP